MSEKMEVICRVMCVGQSGRILAGQNDLSSSRFFRRGDINFAAKKREKKRAIFVNSFGKKGI